MKWAIFEVFIDRDGKTRICSDLFMWLNFLSMKRTLHKSELEIRIAEIESSTPSTIDAAMEIIALCRTRLWELRDKVVTEIGHTGRVKGINPQHLLTHYLFCWFKIENRQIGQI